MDDLVKQAIAELADLARCRCHPSYKDRRMHDPDCNCDSQNAVQIVAARIEQLEAKLALAMEALNAFKAYESSAFFGPDAEKHKRAAYRGMKRKLLAALTKIEAKP